MATQLQQQKLDRYVDVIHEMLQDQLDAQRATPERQITKNRTLFARMFGQLLYEAPNLHTGMVSVRLIEKKLQDPTFKPTAEHHHGRQNGGEALLQLVDRALYMNHNIDRRDVSDIVTQYCQVHYTTADENAALRKHQKQCSSDAAYRRANIVLVDAGELFSKSGRHTDAWKAAMAAKYQPLVDEYNSPTYVESTFTIVLPHIIN